MKTSTSPASPAALALALMALTAAPAAAAEKGSFGLDLEVGSRRLVGFTYHVGPRVAVRPGIFFQTLNAEQTPSILDPTQDPPVYETTETVFGGQLETDVFLRPPQKLAPFVALTAAYSHSNTPYPVGGTDLRLRNGNLHTWSVGAGFGAQYAVSDQLHVFGQVGLSYASGQRFTLNGIKLHSTSWSTSSSAVGVVFYLK
jgi:hypothetical protein